MARRRWIALVLFPALLLAGCGGNAVPVAKRSTTPTTTTYRPAPTATLLPPGAFAQDRTQALPAHIDCQTYPTVLAGPYAGASWVRDLERTCLGDTGSSAFPAPTATAWPVDPLRPTPASPGR